MDNRDATNRDLFVGLLALQNGMVDQDVLILAFRAWTRDKSRRIADILAAQGAIDADERDLLEGLAVKHLRRHGDDPEKSLAALTPGTSIRASLAKIGDPDIEATLGRAAGGSAPPRTTPPNEPAPTPRRLPRVTASGSASSGLTLREAWARSSWRSTPSSTARWRSSTSSTATRMRGPTIIGTESRVKPRSARP